MTAKAAPLLPPNWLEAYGMSIKYPSSFAFSLVELSIVLVILGLLVGSVLSGQALVRAAELRSVTTDYQRYTTAIRTFRDKYFALPGDMNNATTIWTGTTNGNADGMVGQTGCGALQTENVSAWQQLAYANLIAGSYTETSPVYSPHLPNVNIPGSKIASAGWFFTCWQRKRFQHG